MNSMNIVELIVEIDRLRAENMSLAATIETLRSERDTWRAVSGR